jgi:hypothetical protein
VRISRREFAAAAVLAGTRASARAASADNDSLTAVAGIKVGHFTDPRRPTGCTVVMAEGGAVCGVDVRGGAPGTRETDLLDPVATVDRVHAVLLAGGSAFGLDAAGGVMRWLEERGFGYSATRCAATACRSCPRRSCSTWTWGTGGSGRTPRRDMRRRRARRPRRSWKATSARARVRRWGSCSGTAAR